MIEEKEGDERRIAEERRENEAREVRRSSFASELRNRAMSRVTAEVDLLPGDKENSASTPRTRTTRNSRSPTPFRERYNPLEANQEAVRLLQNSEKFARASAERNERRENKRLEMETARHELEKNSISKGQ